MLILDPLPYNFGSVQLGQLMLQLLLHYREIVLLLLVKLLSSRGIRSILLRTRCCRCQVFRLEERPSSCEYLILLHVGIQDPAGTRWWQDHMTQ